MSNFQIIDDETAILMIYQDTFTVARLKELASEKLRSFFVAKRHGRYLAKKGDGGVSFADLFHTKLPIIENLGIDLKESKFIFPAAGVECNLLKLGFTEWKKGKIRIIADIKITTNSPEDTFVHIELEFAFDKPIQAESPLDDIRQSEEYKRLL